MANSIFEASDHLFANACHCRFSIREIIFLKMSLNFVSSSLSVFKIFTFINILCGVTAHHLIDKCIVSRTNENGTCKFVNDCPRVVIEVLEQAKFPTLCGFEDSTEIICCPNESPPPVYLVPTRTNTDSRISAQKCSEYQKICTASDRLEFNHVNGDAKAKEFPYAAILGHVNESDPSGGDIEWVCGGSVISENFVLTVAHCVKSRRGTIVKYVRVGDLDYESNEDDVGARQFEVIEIFVHPSYKQRGRYDDIGLLRINGPIEFNEYIRPICLTDFNTQISENLITAGWGKTDLQGKVYANLRRIQKIFVPHDECEFYYMDRIIASSLPNGLISATQLCSNNVQGNPDDCQGFTGSALINTAEKQTCLYELLGITSFGVSCGIGVPGVYTRVAGYLDWIEDIVWFGGNGTLTAQPPPEPPVIESPSPNRPSVKKCDEYYNIMLQSRLNWAFSGGKGKQNYTQCPLSVVSYIVDGDDALSKEFPHMALVGFDNPNGHISWLCGGSLISENFVLTAAHCLFTSSLGYAKYVLLGDLDYATNDDDAQPLQFNIAERIRHPEYKAKFKYNDIALLRLDKTVQFNDYIRPLCLPDSSLITFNALATGWGRLDFDRSVSTLLQKIELDLFTHKECDDLYTVLNSKSIDRGIINDTQICAGAHSGRGDTCRGDSGGPLQISHYKHSCMFTIVGVTSFGVLCGSGYPGVYTRVFSYIDWIESVVWPNSTAA